MSRACCTCLLLSAASAAATAADIEMPAAVAACAKLRVDAERLACYDRAVLPPPKAEGADAAAARPAQPDASVAAGPGMKTPDSYLTEFWELDAAHKRGTFNFTGYRPSFFLPVHVPSRYNRRPNTPAAGRQGTLPNFDKIESKLQISIRTKVAEGLLLPDADLWVAYTQQSLWQNYSSAISRPFRSTDHEPELIYVVPTKLSWAGWSLRDVGLGVAHQSNGQALPLSRSWSRVYGMAGIERGDFALTARVNRRLHDSDDDNPDFTSYRGRTEFIGLWTPGSQTLALQWRTNFDHRGSVQLDWTMPVKKGDPSGLRWYAQLFSGYAESMLDYNYRQTSLGFGVSLFGW